MVKFLELVGFFFILFFLGMYIMYVIRIDKKEDKEEENFTDDEERNEERNEKEEKEKEDVKEKIERIRCNVDLKFKENKNEAEDYVEQLICEESDNLNDKENVEDEETPSVLQEDDCSSQTNFIKACKDKWKGYISNDRWKKLGKVTSKLNTDLFPKIKSYSDSSKNQYQKTDQNNSNQENESMLVDSFYAQNNPTTYYKLGVILDKKQAIEDAKNDVLNLDNIDMSKLIEVNEKIDKLNTLLFSFEKYTPDFYNELLLFYS